MDPQATSENIGEDEVERTTHSFVVKIWREEPPSANRGATWRGQITHVPGRERQTVQRLGEIVAFIEPYLEQLGVKPDITVRIHQWLRRRRQQR